MSTSSKYSKNKIEQVIANNTCHIITKSFIYAGFESERKKIEYHIYWYNENSGIDKTNTLIKNLTNKKLSSNELSFFLKNISSYELKEDNQYGCIWEHCVIGFNKNKVINTQLSLY